MQRVAMFVFGLWLTLGMMAPVLRAQAPETNPPPAAIAAPTQVSPAPEVPFMRVTLTPRSRVFPGSEAMENLFWRAMRMLRCAAYTMMVCHVLLALWVFADVRKRRNGQWLWVILAILGGFVATAVYALVRIGEKPA